MDAIHQFSSTDPADNVVYCHWPLVRTDPTFGQSVFLTHAHTF